MICFAFWKIVFYWGERVSHPYWIVKFKALVFGGFFFGLVLPLPTVNFHRRLHYDNYNFSCVPGWFKCCCCYLSRQIVLLLSVLPSYDCLDPNLLPFGNNGIFLF